MKDTKRDSKQEEHGDRLKDSGDEDNEILEDVEKSNDVENENDGSGEAECPSEESSDIEDEDDDCDEEVRSDAEDNGSQTEEHCSLSSVGAIGNKKIDPNVSLPMEGKYIPPQLRKLMANRNTEEDRKLDRLKKQLKGLVNK